VTSRAQPRGREGIASRVAHDIPDGWVVNLGIGMPTLVAGYPTIGEVIYHSENGILGVGPPPRPGEEIANLINASKEPVTLVPGGSYMSHTDSFAMIRGGHIDLAVMGAYEVCPNGDFANWSRGESDIPAVGGAMDLASGAKNVFLMMTHCTASGRPKLVESCRFPLTARGVVTRIYTDLATLDVVDNRFVVTELVEGLSLAELQELTEAPVVDGLLARTGSAS